MDHKQFPQHIFISSLIFSQLNFAQSREKASHSSKQLQWQIKVSASLNAASVIVIHSALKNGKQILFELESEPF